MPRVVTPAVPRRTPLVTAGAELLLDIYTHPLPIVIGCTGHAMAAGALLLLAADTRIGAEGEFKIGLPEVAIHMTMPIFGLELARDRLARFRRPLLFYSFTDDDYAPEPAVAHLLALLPHAELDHLRVAPRDLGLGALGHFSFFRRRFESSLWPGALGFLDDVLAGRAPQVERPRSPFALVDDELLADLAHGR